MSDMDEYLKREVYKINFKAYGKNHVEIKDEIIHKQVNKYKKELKRCEVGLLYELNRTINHWNEDNPNGKMDIPIPSYEDNRDIYIGWLRRELERRTLVIKANYYPCELIWIVYVGREYVDATNRGSCSDYDHALMDAAHTALKEDNDIIEKKSVSTEPWPRKRRVWKANYKRFKVPSTFNKTRG